MNPLERVAALADDAEVPAVHVASSNGFDLPGFIQRHGLRVRKEKALSDGTTLYELEVCPLNADHKRGSSFITQGADGRPGFKCHHNSCSGKGWKELRGHLEPDYQSRAGAYVSVHHRSSGNGTTNSVPTPAVGAGTGQANEPPASEQAGATIAGAYAADPARMVSDIEQFIRRFVVLPVVVYLPLAIWIIATYLAGLFDCFPYLALLSPAKRCGKTRLLEVLETLVYLAWRGTAPTAAALFRMMADGPTLLLDEVEALGAKNKSETALTILAILNAGYRKGATIPRCDGQKHELKHFAVYGPKVFAAIGKLPDTLADRSIVISMQRRTKGQKLERFRQARANAEAKPIRDGVARFTAAYQSAIGQAYESLADLKFLSDRDAEMWIPLFALCSIAAPGRLAELQECAIALSGAKAEADADDSLPLRLLTDIRAVWPEGQEKLDTASLLEKLKALEESPWSEYELSPRKVVGFLRPFGVESRKVRVGERSLRGYERDSLEAAFSRYLDSQSGKSGTNSIMTGLPSTFSM
jgi:hypothetical protein